MPTGTVTFLLTDVEGSTAAWERDPEGTGKAIAELDRVVDEVIPAHYGVVVKQRGEGDSHFCVFPTASDAVNAGVALLRAVANGTLAVRIAVHTGEADLREGDYYGRTVNRAARLRSAGHGGQLLVSEVSAALVRDALPEQVALRDLGTHRLKDLSSPELIYEIVHADLPAVTRPLATLDLLRNNLPLQLTPLIGRERDVSDVRDLLRKRRLVSLVALGGTGKTRLALQVAAEASGDHSGGVWYAELAPLQNPDQVPGAILSAVGGPSGTADTLEEAIDWIAARELLLVLDNCEHVLDSVAGSVARLLSRCAGLKVLATSRQPLEVDGESVFRVQPLGLPSSDDEVSLIAGAPAVQLFLERGRSVNPGLQLTESNAPAVAKLCMGLDGLPLAIELAASRLKVLEPEQILERLTDRLSLVDGARASAVNRTVRAAIEWSHDLLKPDESVLFRRLSVFEASAGFEAIEAVCGGQLEDVAVALGGLVDHSLVTVDVIGGERRYRLLDLVRAFAAELLDANAERDAMQRARAAWVAGFASSLVGDLSPRTRSDFLHSQPDVEAALAWRAAADPESFPRCVEAVADVWWRLGRWTVAAHWVAAALAAPAAAVDAELRLGLLLQASCLAEVRWEFRDSIRFAEEALPVARSRGNMEAERVAHNYIASSTWRAGDLERARHHNQQALALALAADDQDSAAIAANNLGLVAMDRGDLDSAEAHYRESLEIYGKLGRTSHGMWRLGEVAEARHDFEEARRLYEAAAAAALAGDWPDGVALTQGWLGLLLERMGDLASAQTHFEAAHEGAAKVGDSVNLSRELLNAARVALRLGEADLCESLTARAFAELAGEPSRQIIVGDRAIEFAREHDLKELAYDLSQKLLEVTLRDGTAKGGAWATYMLARASFEMDRHDEGRRLAHQARARFVLLGDVDVGSAPAARRIEECDELLALIDAKTARPNLD